MLVEALVEWAVVGSGGQWWAVVGACTLEMRVLSTVHGVGSLSLLAIFAANCTGPLPGMKSRHSPELRSHSVPHTPHEIEWLGLPSAATRSFTVPLVIGKRQVRHEPSVT